MRRSAYYLALLSLGISSCGTDIFRSFYHEDPSFVIEDPNLYPPENSLQINVTSVLDDSGSLNSTLSLNLRNYSDDTGFKISDLLGKEIDVKLGEKSMRLSLTSDSNSYELKTDRTLALSDYFKLDNAEVQILASGGDSASQASNSAKTPASLYSITSNSSPLNSRLITSCINSSSEIHWSNSSRILASLAFSKTDDFAKPNLSLETEDSGKWMPPNTFPLSFFSQGEINDATQNRTTLGPITISLKITRTMPVQALRIGTSPMRTLPVRIQSTMSQHIPFVFDGSCP